MEGKRGNILTENIIFIILNLVFLTILIVFLFLKVGGAADYEEKYAKQIALLIDSAEPVTEIEIKMQKALEEARNNGFSEEELKSIINIQGNIVNVKLREKGGYEYSFFNNVNANSYCKPEEYVCVITVNKK